MAKRCKIAVGFANADDRRVNLEKTPYFSIIVPVYNVEKYLARCIHDIQKQIFKDFELILVNDGSTDSSRKICEEFEKKDNRITVVNQNNKGLPGARNTGLKKSQGKWIIFIDSDDRIGPNNFLSVIYRSTKAKKVDVITYGCKQIRENDGTLIKRMYGNMGIMNRFEDNTEKIEWCVKTGNMSISAWTHACSKKFLEDHVLFFDESLKMSEDIEWYFRVLSCVPRVKGLSGTPYQYVVTENSICTKEKATRFWQYREKAVRSAVEAIRMSKENLEFKKILYGALAYQYYIQLADIENEPDKRIRVEAYRRADDFRWLQRYKGDKKTNIARFVIKILGVRQGAKFLNLYMKWNASRKGQPIRRRK